MNELDILIKSSLLHDIGKVCIRADHSLGNHYQAGAEYIGTFLPQNEETRNLVNCIKYHHASSLRNVQLKENDLSYIVYEADNIAAGADRRDIEGETKGFDAQSCLESIFNLFGGRGKGIVGKYYLRGLDPSNNFNYPTQELCLASDDKYKDLVAEFTSNFERASIDKMQNNELLRIMEDLTSYVPSSTNKSEACDISLYVHSKVTAALASCMYQYFQDNNIHDYRRYCFVNNKAFRQEKSFLLVSGDLSGIQSFIYTIPSKGALKSLRGRSFYLEILMEDFIDELLTKLNLSRANLLYSGGGHFYILTANTLAAKQALNNLQEACNEWLWKNFSTSLYMALGFAECSADDLMESGQQRNIFAAVSKALNKDKLCRYGVGTLQNIFAEINDEAHGRECSVCHSSSSVLLEDASLSDGYICPLCLGLYKLGAQILNNESVFAITSQKDNDSLEIFGYQRKLYLRAVSERSLEKLSDLVRLYSKNKAVTGSLLSSRLWLADYAAKKSNGSIMEFSDLAEASGDREKGIKRLGVLRADVDNLGAAFIGGFIDYAAEDKFKYATLSRYADMSKNLSIFFKLAVKKICSGELEGCDNKKITPFALFAEKQAASRKVHVVYSGGDDVFLVGAWDDLLETAVDIRKAFDRFTGGKLSFSAGLALFSPDYPVSQMAKLTGLLEDAAKNIDGKNSIALFGFETNQISDKEELKCRHVYSWQNFEDGVCREKLDFLFAHLDLYRNDANKLNVGMAMLYKMLKLLESIETEGKINIARLAYTLGRMQPAETNNKILMQHFNEFHTLIYSWVRNEEDRRQLDTALRLLIYHLREKGED
ncbi:MAG: type III-A CRISPR-associated protein Cas10/Csm1 [Phascolarctobacterium sp.]|uniref:type III-A CRISPR-associated protein Cas10/Csm1 n=1 Tax=Phascolarctobacterium sp. TaxID=2049039 RepID=UPI0026DD41FD|nr:type III-A CRISPR-associated protein Cas10/Csm1 [Phascolarctobacterium sp.]MDO4921638.1 type III-A CRISPR-associated protein Cas10/Csm1 [Phascolarctobacterium sp.]